jgi:LPXTG-motif cell wall-anchored protein
LEQYASLGANLTEVNVMEHIQLIAGILAVVVLGIIIWRRKRKTIE